ncbi:MULTISPECIES: phosphatidate cytidylyltransferase [Chryseobacterium]|uniref:Phosphatidate cytidylyltransferase n=1 Tax=Chryseobacterium aquaticum TaxID=452084 RepID=A0A848N704_9FLAO|nr:MULTISPECIES: phosphatidate cytidylyltransferase [Chryseobacterium]NMR34410.1 phosphatidate cytidylyltransferase [Chryseobacterium aquaticum]NRQ46606.1 phosphatidate cytidylyltransferase [Chryseobacterium sp. C-204]
MRKLTLYSISLFSLLLLTSCEAVETIFKAGMWWGIIVVVGIIALLLWLFSRGKNS